MQHLPEVPYRRWHFTSIPGIPPADGLHGGIEHLLPPQTGGHQDPAFDGLPVSLNPES